MKASVILIVDPEEPGQLPVEIKREAVIVSGPDLPSRQIENLLRSVLMEASLKFLRIAQERLHLPPTEERDAA